MTLDVAQNYATLVGGTLLVIVLMRVLVIVHRQANQVKDLENQLKLVEKARETSAKKESKSGKKGVL